jgi:hypothetical protein
MKTQLTIIGTNHGKGTSRIWLEGKRLVEAGFEVGTRYDRVCRKVARMNKDGVISPHQGEIDLSLNPKGKFKVSGKGDKPIIDISGGAVTETFAEHIAESYSSGAPVMEIKYSKGKIFIRRGERGWR